MADRLVILNPTATLDSFDMSIGLSGVSYSPTCTILDAKLSGYTAVQRDVGIRDNGSITLNMTHDLAMTIEAKLHAVLGTKVTLVVKMKNASVSTSNPSYTATVIVPGYSLAGNVDEHATFDLELPVDGVVTRATS